MTHCAKCGAELIGSRKFCAACGTPVGDPRSPAASTGQAPATAGPYAAAMSAPGSSPSAVGGARSAPGGGQYAPAPDYADARSAPVSQVNPFAQTAGPGLKVRASDYGPPLAPTAPSSAPGSVPGAILSTTPGVGGPLPGSMVSPLAVSNVAGSRGAYDEALAAALVHPPAATTPAGAAGPQPPIAKRGSIPGTEIMPSFANPPIAAAGPGSERGPAAGGTRQERTQVLAAFPGSPSSVPGAPSLPSASAPSAPSGQGAPSGQLVNAPPIPSYSQQPPTASTLPSHGQQPPNAPAAPSYGQAPAAPPGAAQPLPAAPFIHTPVGAQPPYAPPPPPPPPYPAQQPPMPGWNAAAPAPYMPPQPPMPYGAAAPYPPAQPPGYGYAFGYAPGSRVTVTWSNGQRYPGTVQQVSGTQCLVVFPDGQQHWVEMQYVAPG